MSPLDEAKINVQGIGESRRDVSGYERFLWCRGDQSHEPLQPHEPFQRFI
jgi:hypothetical protein